MVVVARYRFSLKFDLATHNCVTKSRAIRGGEVHIFTFEIINGNK